MADLSRLTDLLGRINSRFGSGGDGISQLGQQPDGDWVFEKADGEAFSTSELLPADGEFTSGWHDTDGWGSIMVQSAADQPSATDGLAIEFTRDVQAPSPSVDSDRTFTYSQTDVDAGTAFRVLLPTQLDGFRVRYVNGDTGQNDFFLAATLRTDRLAETTSLQATLETETLAQAVRAVLSLQDDSDSFGRITRNGEALRTSVKAYEVDTPIRSHDRWQADQISIASDEAERLFEAPLSDRKAIEITNEGPNDNNIYIAESEVRATDTSGYPLGQGETIERRLSESAEVWAILDSSATGSTKDQELSANNTASSSGVTNPDNAFSSDGSDAVFDTQGDTATYDLADFSFSTGFDTIENVDIGLEAAEGSTGNQTIAHEETETAIQEGGTSITTDENLAAQDGDFYVAFVSVRPDDRTVESISGLGLSWAQETTEVNTAGGVRIDIWIGTGTPTNDAPVTANFDDTVTSAAIAVSRWSGVDVDGSPVDATDIDTGSTAAWDVSPSGTQVGDRIIGGSAIRRSTTNDPGGDDTEHSDQSVSNHTMATQSREAAAVDAPTDGTWAQAGDWAAAAIALNQAPQPAPQVTVTYEVGSEGAGPTSLTATIDNTSDETFTEDITGDRTWTDADLDNTALTVTLDNADARDAAVDHVFLTVTEAESTGTQTVGVLEVAD